MRNLAAVINKPLFGLAVSAVIFAATSVLFKDAQFLPLYADFRISAFYPVSAGLFFGAWGALGCAVGNLIADCFGTLNYESSLGALANFLFAWLPYRLWHTVLPLNNRRAQAVSSTAVLIKYVLIAFFSALASMAFLAAGCDLLGVFAFFEFFRPVFLCNIYFVLFVGTTFFLLAAALLPLELRVPLKSCALENSRKRRAFEYFVCAIVIVATGVRCDLPVNAGGTLPVALDVAIVAGVSLLAILPFKRSKTLSGGESAVGKKKGLQFQIVTAFLTVLSVSATFFLFFFLNHLAPFYDSARYTTVVMPKVLMIVDIFGFAFVLALFVASAWIERKISRPLVELAEASQSFVENGLRAELTKRDGLSDEVEALTRSYQKMASDIESYVATLENHAKLEERQRLTLELSAKIQLGMLPKPLNDAGFSLASFVRPAKVVGGDFYYYAKLDDWRLFLCVADVSSKGMPAAMFAAEACTLVKCNRELPLDKMAEVVNDNLCEINGENMFVTMFAGVIDLKAREFEFVNAGHNYPLIWRGGGAQWLKTEPELVLGLFPRFVYRLRKIPIDENFRILLYTDGVVEAENPEREFFGDERLSNLCQSLDARSLDYEAQVANLVRSVEDFAAGAEQSDDITVVMAGFKK